MNQYMTHAYRSTWYIKMCNDVSHVYYCTLLGYRESTMLQSVSQISIGTPSSAEFNTDKLFYLWLSKYM